MNTEQEIQQAIKWFANSCEPPCSEECEQCKMESIALAVLRKEQERKNPKPLTLEELKERVGKPVWCEMQPNFYKCGVIGEKRVSEHKKRLVIGFSYGWEWIEDIIQRGKIYDHEPKEAHDGR